MYINYCCQHFGGGGGNLTFGGILHGFLPLCETLTCVYSFRRPHNWSAYMCVSSVLGSGGGCCSLPTCVLAQCWVLVVVAVV